MEVPLKEIKKICCQFEWWNRDLILLKINPVRGWVNSTHIIPGPVCWYHCSIKHDVHVCFLIWKASCNIKYQNSPHLNLLLLKLQVTVYFERDPYIPKPDLKTTFISNFNVCFCVLPKLYRPAYNTVFNPTERFFFYVQASMYKQYMYCTLIMNFFVQFLKKYLMKFSLEPSIDQHNTVHISSNIYFPKILWFNCLLLIFFLLHILASFLQSVIFIFCW